VEFVKRLLGEAFAALAAKSKSSNPLLPTDVQGLIAEYIPAMALPCYNDELKKFV
jgi:hypothetical protein